MKMFRLCGSSHITEIEVSRFTEKSVWLIGRNGEERRVSVSSDYFKYFESRDDAVNFALKVLQEDARIAKAALLECNSRLETFKKIEGR